MNDTLNHEAIEAAAAAWVARSDAGERWTPEQERALRAWLEESTAHRVAWVRMQATLDRAKAVGPLIAQRRARPDAAPDATVAVPAAAAPVTAARTAGSRRRVIAGWALAAGIALGVGLTLLTQFQAHRGDQYATEVGARESVTLSDGSQVTLNTHTRGRAVVNAEERRFWLDEGEAYFEVAHDPLRPFVVLAGRDRVTVLGTKFSVRHEDGRTEVTVVEGRVKFERATPGSGPAVPVVMTRNESAVATAGNVLVLDRTEQQVRDELGWREGRLSFDGATLGEVAAEFNRYNQRQLVVEGDAASIRLGGTFDAHNLEGFARLVHDSFGLQVASEGEQIVVSKP